MPNEKSGLPYIWISVVLTFVVFEIAWCSEAGSVCKTPNGESGYCISLYECDSILDAISTRTIETLKFSKQSHCGCDESEPLVCCGSYSNYLPVTQTESTLTQTMNHHTIPETTHGHTLPETTHGQTTETFSSVSLEQTEFPESNDYDQSDDNNDTCRGACGCHGKEDVFGPRCLDAGAYCKTPNGERAYCISLYECDVILDAISVRTPEALNFSKQSHCGCDDSEPFVCCGTYSTFVALNFTEQPDIETSVPSTETTIVTTDPPHMTVPTILNTTLLANKRICGYQGKEEKIEGRKFSQVDEYPWLSVIYSDSSNRPVCFGTLISKRYVLTSAACLMSTGKVPRKITRVRLGDYEISKNGVDCSTNADFEECSEPPTDYRVEQIISHEKFDFEKGYEHNIGLIRLVKNVKFTDYIRPICLPDSTTKLAAVGDILHSSGWSYLRKQGEIAKIKKKSKSKLISGEECKTKAGSNAGYYKPNNMICSKNSLPGPCLGDTGVPLMYPNKFQWHLEGILTYGRSEGFCDVNNIVLSTRVVDYMDWILSKLMP